MTDGAAFECDDCGNRVEDAPMRIATCVECGGEMSLATQVESDVVDVGEIMAGDWIVSEYDLDGRPALVVDVDYGQERVWFIDPDSTGEPDASSVTKQGVRAHIPRGERDATDESAQDVHARPQPAASIPKYIHEGLDKQSPDTLRAVAEYAEKLAAYQEQEAERELQERAEQDADRTPEKWDDESWSDAIDEARSKAELPPSKGTLTIKTIDDRDYYYLQWRAGEKIKSQYVAPVTPASNES